MYRSYGTLVYARLCSPWIKIHGYNIARADGSLKSVRNISNEVQINIITH